MAHFRAYLYGQSFTLVTDHQPLKWLMEFDKLTGKLVRWALLLQEFDFEVVHKAGLQNLDADGLSRNPNPLQEDLKAKSPSNTRIAFAKQPTYGRRCGCASKAHAQERGETKKERKKGRQRERK